MGSKVRVLVPIFLSRCHRAREIDCGTAVGSARSCADTAQLLTVQKSTRYNLDTIVAPNSRREATWSSTIATGSAVLTIVLTVDVSPAPANGDRSLGTMWLNVQVQVLVQVSGPVLLVGLRCGLFPRSLIMPPRR